MLDRRAAMRRGCVPHLPARRDGRRVGETGMAGDGGRWRLGLPPMQGDGEQDGGYGWYHDSAGRLRS